MEIGRGGFTFTLAEKGAQRDIKDNEGRTPLAFAEGVFLAVNPPSAKPSTIALIHGLLNDGLLHDHIADGKTN